MEQVYFPMNDPAAMCDYCRSHDISTPRLYSAQIHGADYYAAPESVWEQLYCNLPYNVCGCYPL